MFNFKLKYIEIGPFRSFVDQFRIDLPENGLVLIEGDNLDTGGSSGSGKTNLLLLLEYIFGTAPYSAASMASWYSDEPPTGKIGLDSHKGLIELGRSNKLQIWENGEEFNGSATQKEEHLETKIIGVNNKIRQALTYRAQKKDGLFLNKTNSEKTDFLIPLLNLDRFEEADEIGNKNIKQLTESLNLNQSSVTALEELYNSITTEPTTILEHNLSAIQTIIEKNNNKIKTLKETQEYVKGLNEKEAQAAKEYWLKTHDFYREQEKLSLLQINKPVFNPDLTKLDGLLKNLKECQERLSVIVTNDNAKRKTFIELNDKSIRFIREKTQEYNDCIKLEVENIKLLKEVELLRKHTCPTCNQTWNDSKNKIIEIEDKIQANQELINYSFVLRKFIDDAQAELDSRPVFTPDLKIEQFNKIINDFNIKISTEKVEIESQRREFNTKFAKEIAEAKSVISELQIGGIRAYESIKSKLSSLLLPHSEEISYLEKENKTNQEQLYEIKQKLAIIKKQDEQKKTLEKQIINQKDELSKTTTELYKENDFLHLIGREGFLNVIFDEKLQQISDEVNKTLASVANTRDVVLEFKSESTNAKGTVKKSIVAVVTVRDHTDNIKSALSGGMSTAVELAVDLTVRNVISQNTGVVPGYLILDECFEGLDHVSKEACFELLKIYAKNMLILVIDHASEFKALFDKVITIEFSKGVSKIVDSV